MSLLVISTLGALQITKDNVPLSGFLSDKTRALLIYLAIEQERPLRRERVATLLWPEQPESKSRANLRRALANLRQVIDDEEGNYLSITRQTLQFNPASYAFIDVLRFEQLQGSSEPTLAQLEEAVELVHGHFLGGFTIRDSIPFEEWALLKREEIQRRLLDCLYRLTTYYENHHQPDAALRYAWQLVNLEPWYEVGQRQLLRLLAHNQQRAAALTHYEQFAAELLAELRVSPEPATRKLYEQIREGKLDRDIVEPLPSFMAEPPTMTHLPFVAREAELAQLHNLFQQAVAGRGKISFVTGEAGSGKSFLLRTFAQQIQTHTPAPIPLLGECQAHLGPASPYGPFRAVLAQAVGEVEAQWHNGTLNREQVQRLWFLRRTALQLLFDEAPHVLTALVDPAVLPEDAPHVAVAEPPVQDVLFQQLTHFLQQFSQHGPLLLLLDDLQWADQGSIDLLFYLRRQLVGYPVLIVGTYRPEEVLASSTKTASRHPLAKFINETERDFGQLEIALNRSNGRLFVDAWLDSEPNQLDEQFRQTLFKQTHGHPLFTVELVADMQERGELIRDQHGRWQEGQTVSWAQLPAKAEAIIAERIGRLPRPLHQLLVTASVQGETFKAEVVAQLLERPLHDVIHSLSADLARHHRLVVAQGRQMVGPRPLSNYRFRHNLFQHYLYGRLDPIERAYWHQHTGELLEEIYQSTEVEMMTAAAELAYHFEEAQAVEKTLHYRQLAGQYALRLSAHAEASAHFRRSIALLSCQSETPERIRQEIECQLALGAALLPVQGYSSLEVKQIYERTYLLCTQVAAVPEMLDALFWLTSYYTLIGDLPQALVVSEQMRLITERHEISIIHKIRVHNIAGLPLFFMGRNKEALTHFEQATALYDPQTHQELVYTFGQDPGIVSMIWQGHVLLHMGQLAEAERRLQQAYDWTGALDHPYMRAVTQLLVCCSPPGAYLGRVEEGLQGAQVLVDLTQQEGFTFLYALGLFYMGQALATLYVHKKGKAAQEKVAEGFRLMYEGIALEKKLGSRLGLSSRWVLLADLYQQLDQTADAWHALKQAEQMIAETEERYFEAELWRVKGDLFLIDGCEGEAEACWLQAIKVGRTQNAQYWVLKSLVRLCELWIMQGRQEAAYKQLTNMCAQYPDPTDQNWRKAKYLLGQNFVDVDSPKNV